MLMHLFKDGFKAFASQPLDLLPHYLIPDSSKWFRPPHLYLGWLINKSKLFQYAQKQIPDAVVFESDGTPDYVATFCSYTYNGKDLQNLYSNFDMDESQVPA